MFRIDCVIGAKKFSILCIIKLSSLSELCSRASRSSVIVIGVFIIEIFNYARSFTIDVRNSLFSTVSCILSTK